MGERDVPGDFTEVRAILKRFQLGQMEFTPLAARCLSETIRCLRYKKEHRDELSSTSFALTTFLLGGGMLEDSDELDRLRQVFASSGLEDVDFQAMCDGFFYEMPQFFKESLDESSPAERITLGPGFRQVLRTSSSATPLPADILLLKLLEDKSTGISKRIDQAVRAKRAETVTYLDGGPVESGEDGAEDRSPGAGDGAEPSQETGSAPQPPPRAVDTGSPRRHTRIVREATLDELGLNVDHYATALATILRVADGEFSFALFGRWGSGKTTLLRLLQPLLESPQTYQEAVAVGPDESHAKLEYRVVIHNAWKYRSAPEAWVYLYRSLAATVAAHASRLERSAIALRVATDRNGLFSVFASLLVLAIALIPAQGKFQLLSFAGSALGLSAAIYLLAIWVGASNKVRQLFQRNLRLVGRDENLGMLALIGEDVRLLLRAWTRDRAAARFPIHVILSIAGAVIVAGIWGWALYRGSPFDLGSILQWGGLTETVEKSDSSAADALHWVVLLAWLFLSLMLLALPGAIGSLRPDKILLVVDDLDRCSPEEMLSVIENVRLLLDDSEINSRLQVLMLVDEAVLTHAIETKYAKMIEHRSKDLNVREGKDLAREDIVYEQIEKLFACHLRLARLSKRDVVQLVTKLAGYENEQIRKRQAQAKEEADTRKRAEVERKVRETAERVAAAQADYDGVASGKPDEYVPEDGPSKVHRPRGYRFQFEPGDDFVPMTPREREAAKMTNERIKSNNRRRAVLTSEDRLAEQPRVVDNLQRANAAAEEARKANEELPPRAEDNSQATPQPAVLTGEVRFSDGEVEMLREFVPEYFEKIGRRPSPRSIKALLFKLQLARALLQLRDPGVRDEESRFRRLLAAFRAQAEQSIREDDDAYALIVGQVL